MSLPKNRHVDPVKRAEKRRRQKVAGQPRQRKSVPAQMDHASSNRAKKKAREGEERIGRLTPGVNVDPVDVAAGLRELAACGYNEPHTVTVIEYALRRWARGEEEQAERGAIDRTFHGIDLTSWRRVLAAAIAHAERERGQP